MARQRTSSGVCVPDACSSRVRIHGHMAFQRFCTGFSVACRDAKGLKWTATSETQQSSWSVRQVMIYKQAGENGNGFCSYGGRNWAVGMHDDTRWGS